MAWILASLCAVSPPASTTVTIKNIETDEGDIRSDSGSRPELSVLTRKFSLRIWSNCSLCRLKQASLGIVTTLGILAFLWMRNKVSAFVASEADSNFGRPAVRQPNADFRSTEGMKGMEVSSSLH